MRKRNLMICLAVAAGSLCLAGCGEEEETPSSSLGESSSSIQTKTEDTDFIILRSDLNRLANYDSFSFSAPASSFEMEYKSGTISDSLGLSDPYWLYVAEDETDLTVSIGTMTGSMAGLQSLTCSELGAEAHMDDTKISAEGMTGSDLVLSDKTCSAEFYLKEGTAYAKPNGDLRSLINIIVKRSIIKNGGDASSFSVPENGVKISLSEEDASSIDSSGILPIADKTPLIAKTLLNAVLESEDIAVKQSSEMSAGERTYSMSFALTDPHEWAIDQLGSDASGLLSSYASYDDWETARDDVILPLLEAITSSSIDVRLKYGAESVSSLHLDGTVSFDEEKMKDYVLSQSTETGSASIPLSMSFDLPLSFDWSEVSIDYPDDLSEYEEIEISE